jgi:thiamine pyrophosphate-dependent acetolactate synthase large subunit-like protein
MSEPKTLAETSSEQETRLFGSDLIADLLRNLELPYLAMNPGASFRGLHDSVVNRLGNRDPELVLTLHEAQAVGMAHGYAKVTGKPMGVVLHANVGLMNAVMAIFNAWADRVPMLIVGATGAVDAARRRPWIEWIHTSRDQAAMVRPFVKWDDQPASTAAALQSLMRAALLTQAAPQAPVYVCLDVDIQENSLDRAAVSLASPDPERFATPVPPTASVADLKRAAEMIAAANRPLILLGRHQRTEAAWQARIAFAEACGALVICDQKCGIGFPSQHAAYVAAPAQYPDPRARSVLADADLIISLDWPDVAGTLMARPDKGQGLKTIIVSPDEALHNGWTLDHFPLPEADMRFPIHPDEFVTAIVPYLTDYTPEPWSAPPVPDLSPETSGQVTIAALAAAVERARQDKDVCYTRLTFGWPDAHTKFAHPLDCIGWDGGGGIGSTPGITVGVALALKGTGRLPVAVLGDGDLLMGSQALWTAAARQLPALFIVNNNRSFYNDVEHQETVAKQRNRPVENKFIGMSIDEPPVDLVKLAQSYGLKAFGPVTRIEYLDGILAEAFAAAYSGATVLVDVHVAPPPPRR